MDQKYFVYILTNTRHTVLYTGVTNNLIRRVHEHREKLVAGFTAKYNVSKLVYYETSGDVGVSIDREQMKSGSRAMKIATIESMNAGWRDLYPTLV